MKNTCNRQSFIHNITIATPCTASWENMEGDNRARFCGQCQKNVYNIAALSESEAEKLIIEKDGKLCLRLYRRHDGTILTKDCPIGVAAKIRSYTKQTCVAAAALISLVSAYIVAACRIGARPVLDSGRVLERGSFTMGEDRAPLIDHLAAPRTLMVGMPPPPMEVTAGMPVNKEPVPATLKSKYASNKTDNASTLVPTAGLPIVVPPPSHMHVIARQ